MKINAWVRRLSGGFLHFRTQWRRWWPIGLSFLAYWLMRFWFPLAPGYNRLPQSDIRTFTPSLGWGALYALLLTVLFWLWWRSYQQAKQDNKWLTLPTILVVTLLLAGPLLPTYPINATDVYRYFIRGRITSQYEANPFTVPAADFTEDPYSLLAGEWAEATSPYGPLWELTAALVTTMAPNNLYLGLLLFKGMGLLTHIGITIFLWLLLEQTPKRVAYTLLWAWNPALFLIFVVDAHNDGLMLFWLLLGWYLAQWHRGWGFIVMVLAPLTKPIGLLPLPFFWLWLWRHPPNGKPQTWQNQVWFCLLTIVGSLIVALLAFLPFGSPLALFQRLLQEAGSGGGFSPIVFVYFVGVVLDASPSLTLLTNVAQLIAVVLGCWWLGQTWKNGRSPLQSTANIFTLYLWQALNFRLWYSAWAMPWLLLELNNQDEPTNHYRLQVGLAFLATCQFSVLIYGHIRAYLLSGDHLAAHLIGVPFTFVLPLIIGRWQHTQ